MPRKLSLTMLAVFALVTLPSTAWSQGASGPGCTNLPEYNRALGALQGMTSACDMSVDEARRVIAAHEGRPLAPPSPTRRHRRPPAPR